MCRPGTVCLQKADGNYACADRKTEFEECSEMRGCGDGLVCAMNPGRLYHDQHKMLYFVAWEGKGWSISQNQCECAPEAAIKELPSIATESENDSFMNVRCPTVTKQEWQAWRQLRHVPEQRYPIPQWQAWLGRMSDDKKTDILEKYQQVQVNVGNETRNQIAVDVARLHLPSAEEQVLQRVLEKVQSDTILAPYHQSLALLGRAIMRADNSVSTESKVIEDRLEAPIWYFVRLYRKLFAALLSTDDKQKAFLDNEAKSIFLHFPKAKDLSDQSGMDFLSQKTFAWLLQWYLALFGTLGSGTTADLAAQILPYFWVLAPRGGAYAAPMLQRRAATLALQRTSVVVPEGKCDAPTDQTVTFADLVDLRFMAKSDPSLEFDCLTSHYFKGMMLDLKDEDKMLSLVKIAFGCTREYALSTNWKEQLELYAALC